MSRSSDENSRRGKTGAVSQGFFAASMQLHAAGPFLADRSGLKPRFNVLQRMDRVLGRVGSAVQELRFSDEPEPSLGEALAGVPNELGFSPTVDFRVVVYGWQRELKGGLRDEVFRIGREAIVNAFRHSNAQEIVTEIDYRASELRIGIRDNGCGIKSEDLQWGRNGHRGLQGMRERAERIGARLRLLSKVASGTEVELSVPGEIAFEQTTVRNAC
jgi:signal transduction histidine kinase